MALDINSSQRFGLAVNVRKVRQLSSFFGSLLAVLLALAVGSAAGFVAGYVRFAVEFSSATALRFAS